MTSPVPGTPARDHGTAAPPAHRAASESWLAWKCAACSAGLEVVRPDALQCGRCGAGFRRTDGIWRCLSPEDAARFDRFVREYRHIRRAEGRGAADPMFYRTLPFHPFARDDRDWRIRATTYRTMLARVIAPLAAAPARPLKVLDLGSGNGWLTHRLAAAGHAVAAVDVSDDPEDGLGCHRHYDVPLSAVQATFARLPFCAGQFDLAIFNASFHYSTRYEDSVHEALRVLSASGVLVIADTPVYRTASSGARMVEERRRHFQARFGCASDSLPSEEYLTFARLAELARHAGLRWQFITPPYGWRWAVRPWTARLLGRREPARFLLIVGRRTAATT